MLGLYHCVGVIPSRRTTAGEAQLVDSTPPARTDLPDAPTQIAALLGDREYQLLDHVYGPVDHTMYVPLSPAARSAVFTVSIHDVVTAALESGWYKTVLHTGPVGGDSSIALLLEDGDYIVVYLERDSRQVLYASSDLREGLEGYLARQSWADWLAGTAELLPRRSIKGVWDPFQLQKR